MKFKLSRASDFNENPVEVEVETIEDLKRIVENEKDKSLIIYFKNSPWPNDDMLIIYDYWIE